MYWDNRNRVRALFAALAVALLLYGPSLRADEGGADTRIYGVGRQNCERYVTARENPGFTEVTYKSWISGYLSARRVSGNPVFCDAGYASILALLEDHCRQYPQQSLFAAMQQLSAEAECPAHREIPGNY